MTGRLRRATGVYVGLWLALLAGVAAGWISDDAHVPRVTGRDQGKVFAEVVVTNGRLIAVLALAAVLVARVPEWRPPLDVVVAGLLTINAIAVGAAIGAGGLDVALSLAHLPLEWAALAVAATLYVAARGGDLGVWPGLSWAGGALVLTVLAAGIEAWAPVLG